MLREYVSRRASAKHDAERKPGLVSAKVRHAFRRFRNTYLRNFTTTPPGVIKFWMGHAGEGMSYLYDKIKEDLAFHKQVAEKAGFGFQLPSKKCVEPKKLSSKKALNWTEWTEKRIRARFRNGCNCLKRIRVSGRGEWI